MGGGVLSDAETLNATRRMWKRSVHEFARDLGLSDARKLRRWEDGTEGVPPSVMIVCEYWRRDFTHNRARQVAKL